jgi:hypothetical protein
LLLSPFCFCLAAFAAVAAAAHASSAIAWSSRGETMKRRGGQLGAFRYRKSVVPYYWKSSVGRWPRGPPSIA